jgi:two-component system phosphate regulon sensor histidine kinase PhoR
MNIFDFTFNPYGLISLFAVVTNGILLYLLVSQGLKVLANRWFSITVLFLIVWSVSETLVRFSANPAAANFWYILGMPGWMFVSPFFLSFVMSYINKESFFSKLSSLIIIFIPGFIFLFLGWHTKLLVDPSLSLTRLTFWGWDIYKEPLFNVFMLWLDSLFVMSMWLLFDYWRKAKDPINKRRTLLIGLGVCFPIVIGSFTNGFLPAMHFEILPAAVPLTTIMSGTVTYAILKYKLFVISPSTAATNIVETMDDILVVFNPRYYIEFVNKAVEKILGYKEEELMGQPVQKIVTSDWALFEKKTVKPLYEGKEVNNVELNFQNKEGKTIPVSFSSSLLRDEKGEIFGLVGVATDMRKVRDLLMSITAERNKVTTMMNSIADGIIALDRETKVIMINPAALSMLHLKESEVLGKQLNTCLMFYQDEEKISAKELLPTKKLESDKIVVQKKGIRVVNQKGVEVYLDLTSSAIKEGEQVGLGAIISLTDVSKEKQLEEMKIDFVSMAAHELRTPLTAVRGYLSVLQEEVVDELSSEQKSFLDKAFISSSQLASLVENLLSVSRIERGAVKLQVEPSDWTKITTDVVKNFQPLAREKNIKLELSVPKKLPTVSVDPFRISEVLSNLIANALAYTKSGGTVNVKSETVKNELVTHVEDTGQGIPESALPRLFTKFFRVSGVLEQGSKGTGLGLYISKAIVDMHKGRIWVKSIIGKGSTFSFSLPLEG